MEKREPVTYDELDEYATRLIPRLIVLSDLALDLPPDDYKDNPEAGEKRRRKPQRERKRMPAKPASQEYKDLEQAWEDRRAERRGF